MLLSKSILSLLLLPKYGKRIIYIKIHIINKHFLGDEISDLFISSKKASKLRFLLALSSFVSSSLIHYEIFSPGFCDGISQLRDNFNKNLDNTVILTQFPLGLLRRAFRSKYERLRFVKFWFLCNTRCFLLTDSFMVE